MLSKLYLNQIRGTQGNTLEKLKLCFSLLQSLQSPCCTNLELIYFHSDCLSSLLTWSDSPVRELSSIFKSFDWMTSPSAGRRSPYLTMMMSPTTISPTCTWTVVLLLITEKVCSPSIRLCETETKLIFKMRFWNKSLIYLKTPELFLFTPIIKGSDENYDYYSYEYCKSFNPIGTVIVNLLWKIKEC